MAGGPVYSALENAMAHLRTLQHPPENYTMADMQHVAAQAYWFLLEHQRGERKMVGGKIIDTMPVAMAKVPFMHVWVMDGHSNELQIKVKLTEPRPQIGDSIWWQGDKVYWTDAARTFTDKPLERIGYSHPPHARDFA